MGIHNLFSASRPIGPADIIRERVKAKAKLWTNFMELIPAIRFSEISPVEIMEHLITETITHLHPKFEGAEIFNECTCAAITFKLAQPDDFPGMFTRMYQRQVLAKMKVDAKKIQQQKGQPDNGPDPGSPEHQ